MKETLIEIGILDWKLSGSFTYRVPHNTSMPIGTRVVAPFGKKEKLGIVLGQGQEPPPGVNIRDLKQALDNAPALDEATLQLALFAADYYRLPISTVLTWCLGNHLRDCVPAAKAPDWSQALQPPVKATTRTLAGDKQPAFTDAQKLCLKTLENHPDGYAQWLLDGVTGSGKTEIYICMAQRTLAKGQQVLYMVPEIGLTKAATKRMADGTGAEVNVVHSGSKGKNAIWERMRAGHPGVLVGTRSSLFYPMPQLGLIVVDEEQDASYSPSSPEAFSARDLAIMRANIQSVPVILGSATPSLETLQRVAEGRCAKLSLPQRVHTQADPSIQVLEHKKGPANLIGAESLQAVRETLERGDQAMIFWDLRGYARSLNCRACGWVAGCPQCDQSLVIHRYSQMLACHLCGYSERRVPQQCPICQHDLHAWEGGTERLETFCQEHFPNAKIIRVDRDTTSKSGELGRLLREAEKLTPAILIGTQMMAKGHHFPHLQLAVMIDTAHGLMQTDFRGPERWSQLLIQVAGRVGREQAGGRVLIETALPNHPIMHAAVRQDYQSIAQKLLKDRRRLRQPPFTAMSVVRAESFDQGKAQQALEKLARELDNAPDLRTIGPLPGFPERVANRFRMVLHIHADNRTKMRLWLPQIESLMQGTAPSVRWRMMVSPYDSL